MPVIGLTGTYGCGKSTVSNAFKEKGFKVIDADQIARDVVQKGSKAYNSIVEVFGEEILDKDKNINRKKLASIVFSDDNALHTLNLIVHPEVRKEELRLLELYKNEPLVILDVPLLFENKMEHLVDAVIVVIINEKVRKERLMRRDKCSEEDIQKRLSHQMSQEEKAKRTDYIIDNSSSLKKTINQVNDILKKLDERFYNKKGVLTK